MRKFMLNQISKYKQYQTLGVVVVLTIGFFVLLGLGFKNQDKTRPEISQKSEPLVGVIDESFTKEMNDEALLKQQSNLESVQKNMGKVQSKYHQLEKKIEALTLALEEKTKAHEFEIEALKLKEEATNQVGQGANAAMNMYASAQNANIHMVSFRPKKIRQKFDRRLNPMHYVPSNTHVKAIVLGGADADASVNGQSKNNGVMLFKFIDDGKLPNGMRSRLKGCLVSANSYGDISSERAFATLYKISCAKRGEPIIDKEITGWVFYNGKVGVKGIPLMRDNKVMQWAGISGALSGIAEAAQYAQSVQQIGAFGAQSVVPSTNIAPYAGYGGASKAADVLAQYYVKRAEQYHPVIQVGAGNVVTIVFKDGFYLEPEEDSTTDNRHHNTYQESASEEVDDNSQNFTVPPEVLAHIDSTNQQTQSKQMGVRP